MVVKANNRLRSEAFMARMAPNRAVMPPATTRIPIHANVPPRTGCIRASRYIPALTMVAECRKALIGVGAVIALGSQK